MSKSDAKAAKTGKPHKPQRFNPFVFIQEVRSEMAKVTWPTRRETVTATIMVLIMMVLMALFFMAADQVYTFIISYIVGNR